jgi:hemoglobin
MLAMVPEPISEVERVNRREEATRAIHATTGLDEILIEQLVRTFYEAARRDSVLGGVLARVTDWEAHIARICAFWSSVALNSGHYHGQPMSAHLPLGLERAHFDRWLALFEATARALCQPEAVHHLMTRARRIAQSLELGIAADRNLLSDRRLLARYLPSKEM